MSSGLTAQDRVVTDSGQEIIVYSDWSWEYAGHQTNEQSDPFESLTEDGTGDSEIRDYYALVNFLSREEIRLWIEFASDEKSAGQRDSLKHAAYQRVSNTLSEVKRMDPHDKLAASRIREIKGWYFDVEKPETHYALPAIEHQTATTPPCALTTGTGADGSSAVIKTQRSALLTYTPEKLQNYYRENPYLVVDCQIARSGNEDLVHLFLSFRSKDVKKHYGSINKDGFVRIKFLNGKTVFLDIVEGSTGKIEAYSGYTNYDIVCTFKEKEDARLLSKKYAGDLGIMWTSGFEEYSIYDVGYFIHLMACLNAR